jgi:integrase
MQAKRRARRPRGTGSLLVRSDRAGRRTWYGKIHVGARQVKRRLGLVREPGSAVGLTRAQAEAELRRLVGADREATADDGRPEIVFVAERFLEHVAVIRGRKATTVNDYRSIVRAHVVPFFEGRPLETVDVVAVEDYARIKLREGLAPKTVRNHMMLLSGIFRHAVKYGWCTANPVAAADRPSADGAYADVRFLGREELEALVRAVPDDELGAMERVLYLTAAMTGLRQGELVALRWRDVDWGAGVVRVRRSYTRGGYTTPKSRRSARAVPMAERLAAELKRHHHGSRWTADDDLVFAHPLTGGPYDASRLRKRFKDALGRAGVRRVRFHDLRHTFGTQMAAAGAPLRAIQEWMGHQDHSTTQIYADHAPDPSNGRVWAENAFGDGAGERSERENSAVSGRASGSFANMRWPSETALG